MKSIEFNNVKINSDFWNPKIKKWRDVLEKTCLDKCYEYGQIDNFRKTAGKIAGRHIGMYFNDADVYKTIEGISYYLQQYPNVGIEEEIDHIITDIAAAQESDGYLNTYFSLEDPAGKWTDMEKHEMFSVGQLVEAGIAYYSATGKRLLLDVAEKAVDNMMQIFGVGKRDWISGHEEIEIALIRLYEFTHQQKYIDFAKWLLEERGHGYGQGTIWDKTAWGPAYCQDDVPVKDITNAVGHAVRALFLYTAMARYVHDTGDENYTRAIHAVWQDITDTKMYITGGVGSSRENEGFKESFVLPNESAYSETCAAIANVFFNQQLSLLDGDSHYADIVETCLYNGVLSGISQDARHFFYQNPLASIGNHHRSEWFGVSCCPTNLARFLPKLGEYIYAQDQAARTFVINQYIGSSVEFAGFSLTQQSGFPWDGNIQIETEKNQCFDYLLLRIPAWAKSWSTSGVTEENLEIESGYLRIPYFAFNHKFSIRFEMPIRLMHCNDEVTNNIGKVCVTQGPLVYCAEQIDNQDVFYDELGIEASMKWQSIWNDQLDCNQLTIQQKIPLILTPYYSWDNREHGFMKVWLDENKGTALYNEF